MSHRILAFIQQWRQELEYQKQSIPPPLAVLHVSTTGQASLETFDVGGEFDDIKDNEETVEDTDQRPVGIIYARVSSEGQVNDTDDE